MSKPDHRLRRWQAARSLVVYYGRERAEQLVNYDVAVVEALGQTDGSLAKMRTASTLLLAYLSLLELPIWDPWTRLLHPDDYLQHDGSPLTNEQHGGRLLDLRSYRCQRMLVHRAGKLLAQGYDGLFLDTVDQAESSERPLLLRAELVDSTAALIRNLHSLYPDHLLIQNNGLRMLVERTAPALAGVCWENPAVELLSRDHLCRLQTRISGLAGRDHCRLLLLLPQAGLTPSIPAGVLAYLAPQDYLELP